ncbi:uncharacterized protein LOC124644365 [Helicoverpa zea]|uniref:uncharacterized protein LOC124644365 n=1 Tax=Helicoverpa zea TaxID=7113 RepID=UPI001F59A8E5|nr:uncharacterized protein LOC124644365 [Helicoverpa zea]
MLFSLLYVVSGKSYEKPAKKLLTESMGQEVIEIGTPIKELPMGLEEEPSADEDDEKKITTSTPPSSNKKDSKKATHTTVKKEVKHVEKTDSLNADEDEARIEKELAEIYKDTADYKSDSSEEKDVASETSVEQHTQESTTTNKPDNLEETDNTDNTDKPLVRQNYRKANNLKFEPDSTRKSDVERFRTSVDDINCNVRQKLVGNPPTDGAFDTFNHGISIIITTLCFVFICI